MRFRFREVSSIALVLAGFMSLSACGSNNTTTATITSVAITPTTVTVPINGQTQFTAVVNLSATTTSTGTTISTTTAVTWEVNGTAGGSSTIGTIVPSSTDAQVGVYTAPDVVPTTNNGTVNITAVADQTGTTASSTVTTVTSNIAVITIGSGLGLAVTQPSAIVSAGAQHQFSATLNGLVDANATWSVSSALGGIVGAIDPVTGIYTAPLYPPPGGSVTITATDGANTATATAKIIYSDKSLSGPYAFIYTGADASGFLSVAGSFVADGNGHILSGVEDINSFVNGISTGVPISGLNNTYVVGTDGRGSAVLNGANVEFAMTTNQHAVLTRFDSNTTGSGSVDQQNLNDLVTQDSVVSGPYAFSFSGADLGFKPATVAGKFYADGSGNVPPTNVASGITPNMDVNDNGAVTLSDTSLNGSYALDTTFPGSGRGTITLLSTSINALTSSAITHQLQFAFYVTDNTHLHLVEIDHDAYLGGDAFSAPTGNSFSVANLTGANFVFAAGGNSSKGSYAAGGVFASSGGGTVSGGAIDTNNAGTVVSNTALISCPYTVDATTGRIDLKLFAGTGACPAAGPNSSLSEFAVYQTVQGPALMIEIDANAISTGAAFQQLAIPASMTGNFAISVAGQGFFHNAPASYQPDATGQVTLAGTALGVGIGGGGGNLDINVFNSTFPSDILSSTTSTLSAPSTTNGRGTMLLNGTSPNVTYNLVYYPINGSTALLFDQDKTRIAIGIVALQF
jgi:hypothetical protein